MKLHVIDCTRGIPTTIPPHAVLHFPARHDPAFYRERTDRNIGWISAEEQEYLRTATVGVAGCGGMGGLIAANFLRVGVGHIRIADNEIFDISNINRQFAAKRTTIGKSKAIETARDLRDIADDVELTVYTSGITEETVGAFVDGCDVVVDEIEFFEMYARMLLHRMTRVHGIPVFVCDTVGFGTRLFLFDKQSPSIEAMLQCDIREAYALQQKIREKRISAHDIDSMLERLLAGFVPEEPAYWRDERDLRLLRKRLREERRASIIGTNPPLAAGFVSDRVLLRLLEYASRHEERTSLVRTPCIPKYLYFDAAKLDAHVRQHPVLTPR